jgi:hypothetical protein
MTERLFHISEQPGIKIFEPRPSPSHFEQVTGDVVLGISGKLLHNYLLPRDCPRVTWYAAEKTTEEDIDKFLNNTTADYVMAVEARWYQTIANTTLYCYEYPPETFTLLDECAGYYISCEAVVPVEERRITDIIGELLKRNIELRFMPGITVLGEAVAKSSLNFSLIRMRNAKK